ncbi:hypothetical protein cyc_03809 [Cyclospora cayetanensis]|uniref:Protein phosphatase 1 regulatory subunit 7 n=1 Tax=Cyclospora cayetanensis TaxID=88456 RepID=A0A1D3CW69_9EIME|nr:hypothetical protein cyc_03809 [Cyclospora cayetanensis]
MKQTNFTSLPALGRLRTAYPPLMAISSPIPEGHGCVHPTAQLGLLDMDPPEKITTPETPPPKHGRGEAQLGAGSAHARIRAPPDVGNQKMLSGASEESSPEEESSSVHAQRLGVDLPLDPEEEELTFQAARIFKIENLEPLKKLRKLALIANDVSVIEGLEAQGPTLEQLELYQNSITRIDNVQHLTNLIVLDLSFNRIQRIENLEPLVHLRELFLSSNKITKIEGIATLTELRMLELGSNRIRTVEGIENLSKLKDLWLGKNKITKMELPNLPNLERVSLQSNRLEAWDVVLFERCPKLRELYLSNNNLPSPPTEIRRLEDLTILDLGCNRVEEVEAVAPLNQLQDLWLNDNKLQSLDHCRCLQRLPALDTLYLERNPLQGNLGPGYRQAVVDLLPRLSQLDALLLHTSINIVHHPQKDESPVKPIMKH